jgi:hypothetical protein
MSGTVFRGLIIPDLNAVPVMDQKIEGLGRGGVCVLGQLSIGNE